MSEDESGVPALRAPRNPHPAKAHPAARVISTYRLQLNSDFTLHDARERVPYLHALGVSHLYCSPVLAARAGSTHGYDVADPTQVSPELGGDAAFVALAETAHEHGMGVVLDIVPNHMGIGEDNPYWIDLLTGSPRLRTMIDAGAPADDVVGAWRAELAAFDARRRPYLLYSRRGA